MTSSAILEHHAKSPASQYVDLVFARKDFGEQLAFLEAWSAEPAEKIRQVGRYLGDLFDIRAGSGGGDLRRLEQQAAFAKSFEAHVSVLKTQPRAFAAGILKVWDPEPAIGHTTVRRKASEFDDLLGGVLFDIAGVDKVIAKWKSAAERTDRYRADERARSSAPLSGGRQRSPDGGSLSLHEARKLWDGASFMVQAFGVLFNAHISIRHKGVEPHPSGRPEKLATDFLHELRMFIDRVKQDRSDGLHSLYIHRNEPGNGLITDIVVHLPRCSKDIEAWVMGRFFKRRAGQASLKDVVTLELPQERDSLSRHLALVRRICAGLAPLNSDNRVFLRRTGIDYHRIGWLPGQKITSQRVGLSRSIDTDARKAASQDLPVLSVFDDAAADPGSGWELKEYRYRQAVMEEQAKLEAAASARKDNGVRLRAVRREWRKAKPLREAMRPRFS